MALQNQDGVYCRVINVDISQNRVYIEKWRSATVRQEPTEFDKTIPDSIQCTTLPAHLAATPATGSVLTDVITCGYLALKDEPPFNNAGEEQWIDC